MSTEQLAEEFREHLRSGHLSIQRCASCRQWRHIPRVMCAGCGSVEWAWEQAAGTGRLYSWTTTVRVLHSDFAQVPYTVAVVELDEGPRMVGTLIDLGAQTLRVGARVVLHPPAPSAPDPVLEFALLSTSAH